MSGGVRVLRLSAALWIANGDVRGWSPTFRLAPMNRLNPNGYEWAEELARDLRINGRSLRALLRAYELVAGHEDADGSRYELSALVAADVARDPRVAALPRYEA